MFASDIEDCLELIRKESQNKDNTIKYLREDIRKLKEEYNKDEEIQKMRSEVERMRKDYWRGFPINEKEWNAIEDWKRKHDTEVHGCVTNEMRLKSEGCSGGRYSYHFIPTAIGTSGVIRCNCGEEYEFQRIG